MIASINQDTKDVKLVSVYRDTYLNLGNDTYNKCNSAYARGGPEQAILMLNSNLDMNITDFVTVSFDAMIEVIDALGGVQIDVQEDEIKYLNDYQASMFMTEEGGQLNTNYTPVTSAGERAAATYSPASSSSLSIPSKSATSSPRCLRPMPSFINVWSPHM